MDSPWVLYPRYRTDELAPFVLGQSGEASKVVGYVTIGAVFGKDAAIRPQRRNLCSERHGGRDGGYACNLQFEQQQQPELEL